MLSLTQFYKIYIYVCFFILFCKICYIMENDSSYNEIIDNEIIDNTVSKKICISGTNTRYVMKKATKQLKPPSKRVIVENWSIDKSYFNYDIQYKMLQEICEKESEMKKLDANFRIMISELERKLYSYKQQDIEKAIYNEKKFIDLNTLIKKLLECKLKCYYCNCDVFILYEMSRESTQWTVDRIDNNIGHNKENYVISCLKCNLKRRCKNSDKFMFSQQLKLVKKE
jgi:hypothetical protein